jgi:PadR family transcriptional regulator, regulatory protein PadR
MVVGMSEHGIAVRETTYFVLGSLLVGPLHGYGIIKRAEELSAGRVRLATGALYTALDRLTGAGYVSTVSEKTVAGRVRRTYGLTGAGLAALQAEASRLEQAARVVSAAGHRATVGGIVVVGGRVRVGGRARTA